MLEVKHLKKVYTTKKGAVTTALDDVSLVFPETGMVFILGKSGSGKSTLLNVCGGLDRMDSGEIIIKGKSSKDFTAQDFDSYRNTYVGFVFQEYNVLDEFSVENNVALALELQNKKRDNATIQKILEDVDMKDFAARKPNTLSGGQKQRVAIARALVKEPEIIMADEPTGALDSKTGQQVFDTLKKLSRDKLVIVVSHDRDFAEQYGDRIIELKDGKVISDMMREQSSDTRTIKFYGTNTVCVKAGAELTDADMESIRAFLKKSRGTAVVTTQSDTVRYAKETQPELDIGEFKQIDNQPQPGKYAPQKLIRSRFPMRHAIKMGAGSLKAKPIRLVFTIFLTILAFIMFGLASTVMLFNARNVTEESLYNADMSYLNLSKAYKVIHRGYDGDKLDYENEYINTTGYTQAEYEKLKEKYPNAIPAYLGNMYIPNVNFSNYISDFYGSPDYFIVGNEALTMRAGKLPAEANEVAIPDFLFDALKNEKTTFKYSASAGLKRDQKIVLTDDYNSIIYSASNPVTLVLSGNGNDKELKITGVFAAGDIPSEYNEFKSAADSNTSYSGKNSNRWQMYRDEGLFTKLAVSDKYIAANKSDFRQNDSFNTDQYFNHMDNASIRYGYKYEYNDDYYQAEGSAYMMAKYGDKNLKKLDIYALDGTKLSAVADNSIIVPARSLANIYRNMAWQVFDDAEYRAQEQQVRNQAEQQFRNENGYPDKEDYKNSEGDYDWAQYENDRIVWENANSQAMWEYVEAEWSKADKYASVKNPIENASNYQNVAFDELYTAFKEFDKLIIAYNAKQEKDEYKIDVVNIMIKSQAMNEERQIKLGGFFNLPNGGECVYLSDGLYDEFYVAPSNSYRSEEVTKYEAPSDAYIYSVLIPYARERAFISDIVGMTFTVADDDSTAKLTNSLVSQLEIAIEMVGMLGTIFLWIGVALAVFAFLLMFNFISASITAKKKEIGILRAIGARSVDVFKIFLSEAMIIALICVAVSIAATVALCFVLNKVIAESMTIALFAFGPLTPVMILGVALVTTIVSTVIPVAVYCKKPPISSIRAL